MATGKVKWFNNVKGYGFILPNHGEHDLFAHYSAIQMEGYKTLKAGQTVEYDVIEGSRGLHAVAIVPISDTGTSTALDQKNETSVETEAAI